MPERKLKSTVTGATDSKPRKIRGAHTVCEKLREDILWMNLAPGSALDEVALAARFEVSRTPVREALLLLSGEGYVRFLPNRTTVVAPLSIENVRALFDTLLLLSRSMARSAAMQRNAEESSLSPLLQTFAEHLHANDYVTALKAHRSLYRELSASCNNRFLHRYFNEIQNASVRTKLLFYFPHLNNEEKDITIANTNTVVKQVLRGDENQSDDAIRDAILFEVQVILSAIGPQFGHTIELGQDNFIKDTL